MVQVRTGSYLLWGCEGQRLDVRVVGKGVTKEYQLLICIGGR